MNALHEEHEAALLVRVEIPIRTVSEANQRGHWAKRHSRASEQRSVVRMALATQPTRTPVGPLRIRLTRIAPRRLDSDNLHAALKAVRDGVADYLGVDDGDASLSWEVAQARGAPNAYAVRIEVSQRDVQRAPLSQLPRAKTLGIEVQR
jgi:hypothetical protein